MNIQRKIIHCDCDCFFAAVEMRDDPRLLNVPMAIGGNVDRRGVIATCNYPARGYGVHSAMSTARALQLCPDLVLVSGNMEKYRQASSEVMRIFSDYSDLIEPLSLDEAFIDVTGSEHLKGSATLIAEEIRQRVSEEVGITLSAGVAPNKFLAKVASDWNKPDGQFVIKPEDVEGFVEQLPVKKISGVGTKTALRMQKLGIETCGDLKNQPLSLLVEHFGKMGPRLFDNARGVDDRPVKVSRERKSVSVEHTYPRDLPNFSACLEQLPSLIAKLDKRYMALKNAKQISGLIVKLKFHDFVQTTAEQVSLISDETIFEELLTEAFGRGERPVRLIGVGYRIKTEDQSVPKQLSLLANSASV